MVDERTKTLLKIISKKCPYGTYQVVTVNELTEEFPAGFGADFDLIKRMINYLSADGYLSVRYDFDGDFCLSLTPKGRFLVESVELPLKRKNLAIIDLLPYFLQFLATFLAVLSAILILKIAGAI